MNLHDAKHCPVNQFADSDCISLAHGDGAGLTRQLINQQIRSKFANPILDRLGDAASLPTVTGPLAMTTDSFVVSPLFFPGGDIGSLSITGTLNDLAVAGAQPLWVSLAFIIEEGLPLKEFERVLESIRQVTQQAGITIVAGDTKVVPRGVTDKLFITTTALGTPLAGIDSDPRTIQPGDRILVTGSIAQHGMAIMAARDSLGIQADIRSDCGLLLPAVQALHTARIPIRAMRDATRGGVAAVLHEWAAQANVTLTIDHDQVPLQDATRGMCELLGLDPLMVANEGTMVVVVPDGWEAGALAALRDVPISHQATVIGQAHPRDIAPVTVIRSLGRDIPLDEPAGAGLPRIC